VIEGVSERRRRIASDPEKAGAKFLPFRVVSNSSM
jgi:hypothetical protein